MRRNCRGGIAGFTLTELLVVLLLIGVFSGLMIAEMRGTYEDALLRSSARELMTGLSLASSRAVSLNQAHSFLLDAAQSKFTVQPERKGTTRSGDEESLIEVRQLDERVKIEIRDPAEVPEEEPENSVDAEAAKLPDVIRFYPDGTADAREIVLRDRTDAQLVLRINPVTGRVRVMEEGAVP